MKTKVYISTIVMGLAASAAYAVGLGELKINSYLNQPLKAEIPLFDLETVRVQDIKVSLAGLDEYQRLGLEKNIDSSYIKFSISRNKNGQPVISLVSTERMTEPYLQLLVDVNWPQGQLYKEYTILLDPTGYQYSDVTPSTIKSGIEDRANFESEQADQNNEAESAYRAQSTYGPVKATSETIWQIAQRFNTPDVNIQQVVLAIVGANPQAFENGNLNGMRNGSVLTIPASNRVKEVPADAAKREVIAHETAWKNKNAIEHVVYPPYIDGKLVGATGGQASDQSTMSAKPLEAKPAESASEIVRLRPDTNQVEAQNPVEELPKKADPLTASFQKASGFFYPGQANDGSQVKETKPEAERLKSEIAVASTAVDSVREANATLGEQLKLLQKQNEKLEKLLDKRDDQLELRDKELARLRAKIEILMKERQSVASEAASAQSAASSYIWLWVLIAIALALAILLFIYRSRIEQLVNEYLHRSSVKEKEPDPVVEEPVVEEPVVEEPVVEEPVVEEPVVEEPVVEEPVVEEPVVEEPVVEEPVVEEPVVEEPVVEEPVVEEPVVEEPVVEEPVVEEPVVDETREKEDDLSLDFEEGLYNPDSGKNDKEASELDSDKNKEDKPDDNALSFDMEDASFESYEKKDTIKEQDERVFDFDLEAEDVPEEEKANGDLSIKFQEPEETEHQEKGIAIETEDKSDEGVKAHAGDEAKLPIQDPLKSYKALDTLIDLAETYISMGDTEAAQQSLEEVIENGNEEQKKKAQKILENMNK